MNKNAIDMQYNGKLFLLWIMKNFKQYKIADEIIDEDTCIAAKEQSILKLTIYQDFVGQYFKYSNMRDILVYHDLGSGKTPTAINIFNVLYNANPKLNMVILLKASLENQPWLIDLKKWIKESEYQDKFKHIYFVHYDSPSSYEYFIDVIKKIDLHDETLFVFEEAHNFISGVYNNLAANDIKGKALQIYNYILEEKKSMPNNIHIVFLSGTPAINSPFELALMFNLMRPGIFPNNESEFDYLFSDQKNANMFMRRILGLVSYYKPLTGKMFATKLEKECKIQMSDYQQSIYEHYAKIETDIMKRAKSIFNIYTRLACNFVFPEISTEINPYNRFKFKKNELLDEANIETEKLDLIDILDKYLAKLAHKTNPNFKLPFDEFYKQSELIKTLYNCSAKMLNIIYHIANHDGLHIVYSNFVKMEGLEIFKLYLKYTGFAKFGDNNAKDYHRYIEFSSDISQEIRSDNLKIYNADENLYGNLVKILLLSPAGSEGLSTKNVRYMHIIDPYWNLIRLQQLIGRAIRRCGHILLPEKERVVEINNYYSTTKNGETTDQRIKKLAEQKYDKLIYFLDLLKSAAIDCELFKSHNTITRKYNCFKFNENDYFTDKNNPAYNIDLMKDKTLDNGYMSQNVKEVPIKANKIIAVQKQADGTLSDKQYYWYDRDSGMVFDIDLLYPIGMVEKISGIPNRFDRFTYIINNLINIPTI